jgi:hypothetical protein
MLELLGLVDHKVLVGLTKHSVANPHGTATLERGKLNFVVDRPAKLKNPHATTVQSIFEQFERLGYPAQSIELAVGSRRRVYSLNDGKPQLVQLVPA